MNVHVPFEESPHAFWVIIAIMLAIVVAVAAFFRRRGWL
jgi:magnesium transporter